jgi:hypothetical protein
MVTQCDPYLLQQTRKQLAINTIHIDIAAPGDIGLLGIAFLVGVHDLTQHGNYTLVHPDEL